MRWIDLDYRSRSMSSINKANININSIHWNRLFKGNSHNQVKRITIKENNKLNNNSNNKNRHSLPKGITIISLL